MKLTRRSLIPAAVAALHATTVLGDGVGFIGYGKTLYHPTCAFACRNVIRGCELSCTPTHSTENHGTAHNPVATPPDCFVRDTAFLRTMAICIDTYCPISDNPPLDLIEDYWASHLGTGTLGNYQWVPATSYLDALAAGRADERNLPPTNSTATDDHSSHGDDHSSHGSSKKLRPRQFMTEAGPEVSSPLPIISAGAPLNTTSFIAPSDWQLQYNGMLDFETNEKGHSTYSITIMLIAIFLPVPLSLLRFVPGIEKSHQWSWFQSALINPAVFGKRHREPVAGMLGLVPTRGQALYIFLISVLNIVFWLAPYVIHQPQSTFGSLSEQTLSIVGNRAGVMAMGNTVALFLFAARNNVLLWITDWSYSTYLLLHRWLGYWAVFHTVLHSVMLLAHYKTYGSYEAELARLYWQWGIVATVAVVALVPSSLLIVRQKIYEFFLASHVALALLFIIGYYYHIWYCYEYNWGYEIWAFIAAGIWATDRLARLVRMAWQGYRTATVSLVHDTDGEYLRIDVQGAQFRDGVAYLCFPTLGWRFWETHPFSVAFSSRDLSESEPRTPPSPVSDGKEAVVMERTETAANRTPSTAATAAKPTTTFFARVRTGVTGDLAKRVADTGSATLGVVVDGPYHHSGDVTRQLSRCSSTLFIAGGVGITALLPYLRRSTNPSRLYWATRKEGLAAAAGPALAALPVNVEVETTVGQRLDLDGILEKALVRGSEADSGPLGIIVCGPPGMADHVRYKVVQLSRNGSAKRPYVLIDEAFGW
ncbi:Ferric/cupric reductase transmembrane component 1 [Madurella mycetomatis]|uniref:Ferric/cupric reductase transmembrane component 1 n=1 Tax=Madurella mycetomatis TaxID=100816 RepID=A0A175WBP7_9PEZI|nr:Ferric/cupric reductase transmembrane component 1 [Madurella mycetomatis]KXX81045.1 Ferric/cupric reductase transmembrane component 1 [Madurella mycetomatis]